MRSLKSHILIGSLIAAVGVAGVSHLLIVFAMTRFPNAPRLSHYTLLAITAILFIAFGLAGMRSGLSSLDRLRDHLASVRSGRHKRLEGEYPIELQPLVDDLNELLDHRAETVRRAQAKAGDLAHGLKTPLAVLLQEAERAKAAGEAELLNAIAAPIERMRRQVEYQLAHARAAASGATPGARCSIEQSVTGLVRAMAALHAGKGISIEVEVRSEDAFRGEREDLDEMLGNLLDNACKWGRLRVTLSAHRAGSDLVITVDDDGPGIDPVLRESVLHRGVRADESAPGSGLGLAIVRDLAELYGGSISIESSPAEGVRARLTLPAV